MSIGMSVTDMKILAREEFLDAIDEMIAEKSSDTVNGIDLDTQLAFNKERNRVAKFLGLPTKPLF